MPWCWYIAGHSASMAVPNVSQFRRAHSLVGGARAVCLAKSSSAPSAKTQPWQSRTRRMNEALRTGIPYTVPQCVGFDHYYASGSQHMSESKSSFWACLSRFDSVTPTQTSETSSRSQRGVVLWIRTAAAQRARVSQSQSQLHCSL